MVVIKVIFFQEIGPTSLANNRMKIIRELSSFFQEIGPTSPANNRMKIIRELSEVVKAKRLEEVSASLHTYTHTMIHGGVGVA